MLGEIQCEPLGDGLRDKPTSFGVQIEMRIAGRMQLPFRSTEIRRDFFGSDLERHVDIPAIPFHDF